MTAGKRRHRCFSCARLHVVELGRLEAPVLRGVCMHYGDSAARPGCPHYVRRRR